MIRPQQCPICRRPVVATSESAEALFPFCSERCRSVDLYRWWGGRYAIVEDLDPQEAELMQFDPDIAVDSGDDEG